MEKKGNKKYKMISGTNRVVVNPNQQYKKVPYFNAEAQPDYSEVYDYKSQKAKKRAIARSISTSAIQSASSIPMAKYGKYKLKKNKKIQGTQQLQTQSDKELIDPEAKKYEGMQMGATGGQAVGQVAGNAVGGPVGGAIGSIAGGIGGAAIGALNEKAYDEDGKLNKKGKAANIAYGMNPAGVGVTSVLALSQGDYKDAFNASGTGMAYNEVASTKFGKKLGLSRVKGEREEEISKIKSLKKQAEMKALAERENAKASGKDVTQDMKTLANGTKKLYGNGGYKVLKSSERKGKTHKVISPSGKVQFFGDSKLGQHPKDESRKKAFWARHRKNINRNPAFKAFANATWKQNGSKNIKMKYKYKDGVREILTEDRELHLLKKGSKYLLLNNPTKGVTHTNNKNEGRNALVIPKGKYKLKDVIQNNMNVSKNPKDSLLLPEGTSIVTAKNGLNKIALKAYKKGDYKTIDKIVNKMPEDKPSFDKGTKKVKSSVTISDSKNSNYKKKTVQGSTYPAKRNLKQQKELEKIADKYDLTNPDEYLKFKKENKLSDFAAGLQKERQIAQSNQLENFNYKGKLYSSGLQKDMNILDDPSKTKITKSNNDPIIEKVNNVNDKPNIITDKSKDTSKSINSLGISDDLFDELNALGTVRVSDVNNVLQGLKKAEKDPLFIPDLNEEIYNDLSDPSRRKSTEAKKIQGETAKELSGGNVANIRANKAIAAAEDANRQQDINTFEIGRATDVINRNTERRNRYAEIIASKKQENFENNQANRLTKEDQLQEGLMGFDEANYRAKRNRQQSKADKDANALNEKYMNIQKEQADKTYKETRLAQLKQIADETKDPVKKKLAQDKYEEEVLKKKGVKKLRISKYKYKYK